MKKKLICTLNISNPEDIITLFNSETQVIRINFSHIKKPEDYDKLKKTIKIFNELKKENPERICYLGFDTHGPEIRTINSIKVKDNEEIIFVSIGNLDNKKGKICILNINKFNEDLKVGEFLIIENKQFEIKEVSLHSIITKGIELNIEKNKSVSIPRYFDNWNINTHKYLNEKDENILKLAFEYKISIIFLSFIQNEYQVKEIKLYLNNFNKEFKPIIISKLEDRMGVENFIKIQEISDGIMIGRGDLYQNIGIENSFSSYLYLISIKSKINPSKILILATGICESLSKYSRKKQILKKTEITELGISITNEFIDSLMFDETATGNINNILYNIKSVIIDTEKYLYSCFKNEYKKELCMCETNSCISFNNKNDEFFSFLNYQKICKFRLDYYNKKLKSNTQLPYYLPFCIEIKEITSTSDLKYNINNPIIYLIKESNGLFVMKGNIYFLK